MKWDGKETNEKNNFKIFFPCLGVYLERMESSFPYLRV